MMGEWFVTLALVPWCAYEGWKWLTAKNNEWLNTKEPLNIVVKIILCVVLGWFFAAWKVFKLALHFVNYFRPW